jgi:CRISPR-associated endonuclease/helicase Cas3
MSSDAFLAFWGKAAAKDQRVSWHPLAYHSMDVAACGHVLLRTRASWRVELAAASGLGDTAIVAWFAFLLMLHDLGKFGLGFQAKNPDVFARLHAGRQAPSESERHDTLGYAVALQYLAEWLDRPEAGEQQRRALRPWLAAVTGHHGRPPRNLGAGQRQLLLRDQLPRDCLQATEAFVRSAAQAVHGTMDIRWTAGASTAQAQRCSWHVAGLAVLCDWLGSNTRWFPYRPPDRNLHDYWHTVALPAAEQAVTESGVNAASPSSLQGTTSFFPGITRATPLQQWVEQVSIAAAPQLFVLEDLTGSGKTEAALTLAARLMQAGRGQGVYVALPTMATADAIFDRVRGGEQWRRFFSSDSPSLALAHSADWLRVWFEGAQGADGGYGRGEDPSATQERTAWLADGRKKALLADFGVGTIDQALLAILPVRHQSLRLLGLATKVLVVDEVHACDCYVGELLARLLRFHAARGGSAILLSATLPLDQRQRLVDAFAGGLGVQRTAATSMSYPLATRFDGAKVVESPIQPREANRREVHVGALADAAAAMAHLRNAVSQGRCAVWVRNTVADAIDSWREWQAAYPHFPALLFHARFALVDRLALGKQVLETFGPMSGREARFGRLVIATQVIEQSLDVDFDDMVCDLAPIDLVLQRAGRLHRHARDASGDRSTVEGRGGARLAVLMPQPEAEVEVRWFTSLLPKAGKVYPDHGRLWLTARWLADKGGFELGRDARDMIEFVYGEPAFERMPPALQRLSQQAAGACSADKGIASLNALRFDQGYEATGDLWQDGIDTPTRLGEPTVRVRLARTEGGTVTPWARRQPPIDWALSELTVAKRLIGGESARSQRTIEAARATMPDEGRYCVVVVLEPFGDAWAGWATNRRGEDVRVVYSPVMGLRVEKDEESDESDL